MGWCDSVGDLSASVFGIKGIMERSQNEKIDWHGVEGPDNLRGSAVVVSLGDLHCVNSNSALGSQVQPA